MSGTAALPRGRVRAGWWTLVVTGALLFADGVWLATSVAGPDVFAADTGVPMAEVAAAYPTVVALANQRGVLVGILLLGLGALGLLLAWSGLRAGPRVAWVGQLVMAATLTTLAATTFAAGAAMVGATYAAFAVATATGVALTAGDERR